MYKEKAVESEADLLKKIQVKLDKPEIRTTLDVLDLPESKTTVQARNIIADWMKYGVQEQLRFREKNPHMYGNNSAAGRG